MGWEEADPFPLLPMALWGGGSGGVLVSIVSMAVGAELEAVQEWPGWQRSCTSGLWKCLVSLWSPASLALECVVGLGLLRTVSLLSCSSFVSLEGGQLQESACLWLLPSALLMWENNVVIESLKTQSLQREYFKWGGGIYGSLYS